MSLTLVSLYCPQCTARLDDQDLLDNHAQGGRCENSHRYYLLTTHVYGQMSKLAAEAIAPASADNKTLIQNWLTRVELRTVLNDQLAEILERIFQIECGLSIATTARFNACPFCAKTLKKFAQDDAWVEKLACESGHEFTSRAGLHFEFESLDCLLKGQMSDKETFWLAKQWLAYNDIAMARQVHSQVKNVLTTFVTSHRDKFSD